MKMLCLFFLLVSNSLIASPAAIEVLSASGLTHSIAQARTMYADIGDSVFFKQVEPSEGMLLLTDDGVIKFKPGTASNRVVVAVVKNYS
jgi:hypothetical protein